MSKEPKVRLKKNGEPDLRATNSGGHKTAGAKKRAFEDKKQQVEVFLTPNEFESSDWKSNACDQVERKMKEKIKKHLRIKN